VLVPLNFVHSLYDFNWPVKFIKLRKPNQMKADLIKTICAWVCFSALIWLNSGCSAKSDLGSDRSALEIRIQKIEEQLKGFESEIRTKSIRANTAKFTINGVKDRQVSISALGIEVKRGEVDDRGGDGMVAMLTADEFYLEDTRSHHSIPAWGKGRGIKLSLEHDSGDSPEIRMWHKDSDRGKSIDKKFSEVGEVRTEVTFLADEIGQRKGFFVLDGEYGSILLNPTEFRELGSEGVLTLKIASTSGIPLSGIKGKVKFRVTSQDNKVGSSPAKSVSFILDKRIESGTYIPVVVPLGVSKEAIRWLTIGDVEALGVFIKNTQE